MRKIAYVLLPLLLSGCYVRQTYYVSPFNGNTVDYHTQPLVKDSVHSGVYVNAAYFTGNANDDGTDWYKGFHTEIYRSHHAGIVQGYYGLGLSLGSFTTGKWDSSRANNPYQGYGPQRSAVMLNKYAGDHAFSGIGFNGGINLVMPTHGGEWRYLGVETSLRREFGDYLAFRRQLPDTVATLDVTSSFFATMGVSSELIGRTQHGEFGFRLSTGWVLGSAYRNLGIHDNATAGPLEFHYTSFSFHYTYGKYTGYVIASDATKAAAWHMGVNYRLGRPRFRK